MAKIVKLKTGSKFEDQYSYSRLVCVDQWIFVSNTAGRNPETKLIPEDIVEQTLQVFANIEYALKSVGSSLDDVISTRVFVQNPEDTLAVMDILGEKFKGIDPAITVTNPPLGSVAYKVELDITAYKGASTSEIEHLVVSI